MSEPNHTDEPQHVAVETDAAPDVDQVKAICANCGHDQSQLVKRATNAVWKQARLTYGKKSGATPAIESRIGKLETLVTEALGMLIPGLSAPPSEQPKAETK